MCRYLHLYGLAAPLLGDVPGRSLEEDAVSDLLQAGKMAVAHAAGGGGPEGVGDEPPAAGAPGWSLPGPVYMGDVERNWGYVLLDCLLVLLRHVWEPLPSAPLRDAVEACFRCALCSHPLSPPRLLWAKGGKPLPGAGFDIP